MLTLDVAVNSTIGFQVLANTTNCLMLLETYLSPNISSDFVKATQLYQNTSVPIAMYEDCYLWLAGGKNATTGKLDENDAVFVGNYDLSEAVSGAIETYADFGNVSTMAVCGTLTNCPVNNTVTGVVKTGSVGFEYCVGGASIVAYNPST